MGAHELGPRRQPRPGALGSPADRAPRGRGRHDLFRQRCLRRARYLAPGTTGRAPLVAIYTGHGHDRQTQNLAASLDRGRTWTKFAGNPVLDIGSKEFRDPKVFWHRPTGRWIMATVLADKRQVRFWGSADLTAWEQLSDFGPAGATKGVWECPELFEAPVDGDAAGATRWVLKVDVNDGAPFGGSGGQYFVGHFDGKQFLPEAAKPSARGVWIDFGKDFYAAQAWNDAPGDGRPVWIAWMNNWQYANEIPTAPWRGAMTIPRTVSLHNRPRDCGWLRHRSPGSKASAVAAARSPGERSRRARPGSRTTASRDSR